MTKEQAIKIIRRYECNSEHYEACEIAIKALEQSSYNSIKTELKPCEDAISRQSVNTLIDELARAISDERCCISRGRSTATIMQDILDLPPVNPQPKIGHWIKKDGYSDCSECGSHIVTEWDYCPKCGARMIEPQERSRKNEKTITPR